MSKLITLTPIPKEKVNWRISALYSTKAEAQYFCCNPGQSLMVHHYCRIRRGTNKGLLQGYVRKA